MNMLSLLFSIAGTYTILLTSGISVFCLMCYIDIIHERSVHDHVRDHVRDRNAKIN